MMGWYEKLRDLEDEVIKRFQDAQTEALRAVSSGSIQKGIRLTTGYASTASFPAIEVAWSEETWEGGTQRSEHTVELQVAALVKSSKPLVGIEKAKQLVGECYDILWDNPALDCQADILPDGNAAVMPAILVGQSSWVYAVVATFNYHLRF